MSGTNLDGDQVRPDIPRDKSADSRADTGADTRWLSYRELAEILAPTKVESVIRLVRRKGWPKRDSNNGVRVAVPEEVLEDMRSRKNKRLPDSPSKSDDVRADILADIRGAIAAVEGALTTVRNELAATRAGHEREREKWEEQITDVRTELDRARRDLADQRAATARAEGTIEGLQTAIAQRRSSKLGSWLRAAFRPGA